MEPQRRPGRAKPPHARRQINMKLKILAKGPDTCSCEHRNRELILRRRSPRGHEPHQRRAEMLAAGHATRTERT
eukprot:178048-Pyramimonas_sp.AAC.1